MVFANIVEYTRTKTFPYFQIRQEFIFLPDLVRIQKWILYMERTLIKPRTIQLNVLLRHNCFFFFQKLQLNEHLSFSEENTSLYSYVRNKVNCKMFVRMALENSLNLAKVVKLRAKHVKRPCLSMSFLDFIFYNNDLIFAWIFYCSTL